MYNSDGAAAAATSLSKDIHRKVSVFLSSSTYPSVTSSEKRPQQFRFKCEKSLNFRLAESAKIRSKYPDRIPIIVEKSIGQSGADVPDIDKKKFLVPHDLTIGQFVYVIRKRIKLRPEEAIFIFVRNALPPTSSTISMIYDDHRDEDGFLYMTYSGENTFGWIP